MTVPTIVGHATHLSASANSITATLPTAIIQNGDYLLAAVRSQGGASTRDFTATGGFARVGVPFLASQSDGRAQGFFGRAVPLASALPATVTFDLGFAGRLVDAILVVRGVDLDNPIVGWATPYAGLVSNVLGARGSVADSFSIGVRDSLVIVAAGNEFSADVSHTPLTTPDWVQPVVAVATSQATTGSRTAMWIGAAEHDEGMTPQAPVYWQGYSGGATQAIALRSATPSAGNAKPVARLALTADQLNITADARGSSDSDGTIAGYSMTCNGVEATGENIHVFTVPTAGTYTVSLTVTDNSGETSTTSQQITVTGNAAPTAVIQWQRNALAITANGDLSSDTDGTVVSYAWEFGDGATATGKNVTHTYGAAGTYQLSLTVTDNGGRTASASTPVEVVTTAPGNQAPVAWFTTAIDQLKVTATGTASSDPDGTIASWSWNWGDGSTSTGSIATHTYGEAGPYTITLTVTDNAGATSTTTRSVTVAGVGGTPVTSGRVVFLPRTHHQFTVAEMLAEQPFYWGHRGASKDWGEMTMRGYTNAVFHGAKCLEVSVRRSSDGVFVMSHDADTLRVTGVNRPIATTPWAQLKGMPVTVPRGGGVIGELGELLTAYRDLVLIIDDKTYQHDVAMLDFIESFYPSREEAKKHVIIKQHGGGGAWSLAETIRRGYTTWGYAYGAEIVDKRAELMQYTLIGLDYQATAAQWAEALKYNKPVVGHIIDTPEAAALSLQRGASGLQVSAVRAVIPMVNEIDNAGVVIGGAIPFPNDTFPG